MRGLVVLVAAALATPAAAQTMREFSVTRQQQGEPTLAVQVDYVAGTLDLAPAPAGILYRFILTYDEQRFAPLAERDRDGTLRLGASPLGAGGVRVASTRATPQAATIGLSEAADLDLGVRLDAAQATLELGGLRLERLALAAGTSRATVRVSQPNPVRCTEAAFEAGAGELLAAGLGNARCERVVLRGGAGRVTLDFSGNWRGRMAVRAEMKVGELVLRLPRRAGVRLATDTFLASFAPAGLTSADGGKTWTSAGFATTPYQLDVSLESAVGGVRVEWID